jgi:hypothetical protein
MDYGALSMAKEALVIVMAVGLAFPKNSPLPQIHPLLDG